MFFEIPGSCVSSPTLAVFRSIRCISPQKQDPARGVPDLVRKSPQYYLLWWLHGRDGQVASIGISMHEHDDVLILITLQCVRIGYRVALAAGIVSKALAIAAHLPRHFFAGARVVRCAAGCRLAALAALRLVCLVRLRLRLAWLRCVLCRHRQRERQNCQHCNQLLH
jgi:hypothetical protein